MRSRFRSRYRSGGYNGDDYGDDSSEGVEERDPRQKPSLVRKLDFSKTVPLTSATNVPEDRLIFRFNFGQSNWRAIISKEPGEFIIFRQEYPSRTLEQKRYDKKIRKKTFRKVPYAMLARIGDHFAVCARGPNLHKCIDDIPRECGEDNYRIIAFFKFFSSMLSQLKAQGHVEVIDGWQKLLDAGLSCERKKDGFVSFPGLYRTGHFPMDGRRTMDKDADEKREERIERARPSRNENRVADTLEVTRPPTLQGNSDSGDEEFWTGSQDDEGQEEKSATSGALPPFFSRATIYDDPIICARATATSTRLPFYCSPLLDIVGRRKTPQTNFSYGKPVKPKGPEFVAEPTGVQQVHPYVAIIDYTRVFINSTGTIYIGSNLSIPHRNFRSIKDLEAETEKPVAIIYVSSQEAIEEERKHADSFAPSFPNSSIIVVKDNGYSGFQMAERSPDGTWGEQEEYESFSGFSLALKENLESRYSNPELMTTMQGMLELYPQYLGVAHEFERKKCGLWCDFVNKTTREDEYDGALRIRGLNNATCEGSAVFNEHDVIALTSQDGEQRLGFGRIAAFEGDDAIVLPYGKRVGDKGYMHPLRRLPKKGKARKVFDRTAEHVQREGMANARSSPLLLTATGCIPVVHRSETIIGKLFDERIATDPSEFEALKRMLAGENLMIVRGWAGNGKTTLIREACKQLCTQGKSVLVVAPSNQAVDNALQDLIGKGFPVVRLGNNPDKMLPEVREKAWVFKDSPPLPPKPPFYYSPEEHCEYLREEHEYEEAKLRALGYASDLIRKGGGVIGATCVGAVLNVGALGKFDTVIVDESTMASMGELACVLSLAKNGVLIGDVKQLPSPMDKGVLNRMVRGTTYSDDVYKKQELESIWNVDEPVDYTGHRKNEVKITEGQSQLLETPVLKILEDSGALPVLTLRYNYRMHPVLAELVSMLFYDGQMESRKKDLSGGRFYVFDTSNVPDNYEEGEPSKFNLTEAEILAELVLGEITNGHEMTRMGIIAPYRAQVRKLWGIFRRRQAEGPEGLLKGLRGNMGTVDKFQGSQRPLIFSSFVRSAKRGSEQTDEEEHTSLGFVESENRLLVALSRAEEDLFLIGNFGVLTRSFNPHAAHIFQTALDHARSKGRIFDVANL